MADPSRAVPKRRRSNSRGRVLDASSTAAQRPVEQELTDRGRQTRERVLAASRRVFERDGYLDARVADFVKEAGVSH